MPPRNPYPTAAPFLPDRLSMTALRDAVQRCRGCPLYANATQAVFGEGTLKAEVMLVGEQPGDQEDLAGAPFVGPAGKLLDRALEEAGIDRNTTYVTNAVKHFKWKARGTRRIHDKPSWTETMACRPWLDAELALVKPRALVLLGAVAAQALLGKSFKVTQQRGKPLDSELADLVVATIHPSAVLRAENRDTMFAGLVDDLRVVSGALHAS
ncbi:MAG TPA: UdgX family uracil-DNA binding protein [Gaiellaceae bacterium]|nr:UdgX family uracil-DNA binding protein [Gaiellaceae bacterium]